MHLRHSVEESLFYFETRRGGSRSIPLRIGCLQLQVSFRKRATNYRALLRKITSGRELPSDETTHTRCGYVVMYSHIDSIKQKQKKAKEDFHSEKIPLWK